MITTGKAKREMGQGVTGVRGSAGHRRFLP